MTSPPEIFYEGARHDWPGAEEHFAERVTIWLMADLGYQQKRIAHALGISATVVSNVTRRLRRDREEEAAHHAAPALALSVGG